MTQDDTTSVIRELEANCPIIKSAWRCNHAADYGRWSYKYAPHQLTAAAAQLRDITAWFRDNPGKRAKGDLFEVIDGRLTKVCLIGARGATRKMGIHLSGDTTRDLSRFEFTELMGDFGLIDVNDSGTLTDTQTFAIFDKVAAMLDEYGQRCSKKDQDANEKLWLSLLKKNFRHQIKARHLQLSTAQMALNSY